jgi:hypothetical protein
MADAAVWMGPATAVIVVQTAMGALAGVVVNFAIPPTPIPAPGSRSPSAD